MHLNITNKLGGKCIPATFDDFALECVHYHVNICREKRVIFIKGLTLVLFQLANSWDILNILLTMNLKQNVRLLTLFVIWGYTVLLAAIKDYQRKLGSELKGSFVVTDAPVWKCLEFFL